MRASAVGAERPLLCAFAKRPVVLQVADLIKVPFDEPAPRDLQAYSGAAEVQLAFRVYDFLRALDPPPHVVYFTDWQVTVQSAT